MKSCFLRYNALFGESFNPMSDKFNKMEFSGQRENPALRETLTILYVLLFLQSISAEYENKLQTKRISYALQALKWSFLYSSGNNPK